jgi:hypothetical protein
MPAAAKILRPRALMWISVAGHVCALPFEIRTPTKNRPKPASSTPSGITCNVAGHAANGRPMIVIPAMAIFVFSYLGEGARSERSGLGEIGAQDYPTLRSANLTVPAVDSRSCISVQDLWSETTSARAAQIASA